MSPYKVGDCVLYSTVLCARGYVQICYWRGKANSGALYVSDIQQYHKIYSIYNISCYLAVTLESLFINSMNY